MQIELTQNKQFAIVEAAKAYVETLKEMLKCRRACKVRCVGDSSYADGKTWAIVNSRNLGWKSRIKCGCKTVYNVSIVPCDGVSDTDTVYGRYFAIQCSTGKRPTLFGRVLTLIVDTELDRVYPRAGIKKTNDEMVDAIDALINNRETICEQMNTYSPRSDHPELETLLSHLF